jgi:hypothetical protein
LPCFSDGVLLLRITIKRPLTPISKGICCRSRGHALLSDKGSYSAKVHYGSSIKVVCYPPVVCHLGAHDVIAVFLGLIK